MRCQMHLFVAVLVLCTACHYVTAPRTQAPLYDVPLDTEIAIVAIDVLDDTGECPDRRRRPVANHLLDILTEQLAESRIRLVDRSSRDEEFPHEPVRSQIFPLDISEPLVLWVRVLEWPCPNHETTFVDVRFALFTREGRQIESQTAAGTSGSHVEISGPGRPFIDRSAIMALGQPRFDADALAFLAIEKFTSAFRRTSRGFYNAMFDHRGAARRAIALAREGKFVEAIRAWQQLGDDPAALFNIGQLLVLWGLDRSALVYFDRAHRLGHASELEWVHTECTQRVARYERPLLVPADSQTSSNEPGDERTR